MGKNRQIGEKTKGKMRESGENGLKFPTWAKMRRKKINKSFKNCWMMTKSEKSGENSIY